MNYYYDIILNWQEKQTYEFYEWNDFDNLELIKKIPLFKVKHKVFLDILENNIKVSNEFLEMIQDKTLVSTKKVFKKITYACLFTDTKNVIALEFNDKGISICRSNLLVDDELNVLEVIYGMKETIIEYEVQDKILPSHELRQIKEAKNLILIEMNSLIEQKDLAKLKYLYYEYKHIALNDINEIYKRIINELENNFNEQTLKLYYIIKLSYHKV